MPLDFGEQGCVSAPSEVTLAIPMIRLFEALMQRLPQGANATPLATIERSTQQAKAALTSVGAIVYDGNWYAKEQHTLYISNYFPPIRAVQPL